MLFSYRSFISRSSSSTRRGYSLNARSSARANPWYAASYPVAEILVLNPAQCASIIFDPVRFCVRANYFIDIVADNRWSARSKNDNDRRTIESHQVWWSLLQVFFRRHWWYQFHQGLLMPITAVPVFVRDSESRPVIRVRVLVAAADRSVHDKEPNQEWLPELSSLVRAGSWMSGQTVCSCSQGILVLTGAEARFHIRKHITCVFQAVFSLGTDLPSI